MGLSPSKQKHNDRLSLTMTIRDQILVDIYNGFHQQACQLIHDVDQTTCEVDYIVDIYAQCIRMNNIEVLKHMIKTWIKSPMITMKHLQKLIPYLRTCSDEMLLFVITTVFPYPINTVDNYKRKLIVDTWDIVYDRAVAHVFIKTAMERVHFDARVDIVTALIGSRGFEIARSVFETLAGTKFQILDKTICDYLDFYEDMKHVNISGCGGGCEATWAHLIDNTQEYFAKHDNVIPQVILDKLVTSRDRVILLDLMLKHYTTKLNISNNACVGCMTLTMYKDWVNKGFLHLDIKEHLKQAVIHCNEPLVYHLLGQWQAVTPLLNEDDIEFMILNCQSATATAATDVFRRIMMVILDSEDVGFFGKLVFKTWNDLYVFDKFIGYVQNIELFRMLVKRGLVPDLSMDFLDVYLNTGNYARSLNKHVLSFLYYWLCKQKDSNEKKTLMKQVAGLWSAECSTSSMAHSEEHRKYEWEP